jgi:hypothetical protein
MGPLSGKQHREYLKFQNKEAREAAKMELNEQRKQQLHEIKLQEAAAKANQGLGHKEKVNNAKLKEMGMPSPKMNKQKLGIPSQNPLAGTGMFKQGQRSLPQPLFQAQGTDTVPAMLTPGEAVIPRAAAQDPKNKKAIKRMVEEGRKANKLRDGAVDVRYSDAPGQAKYHSQGTDMVVPSLAYRHFDVPGSSFEDGTEHVFSRGSADMQHYNNGTYGVVPQQVQQAAGYFDGDTGIKTDSDIDEERKRQQAQVTIIQPTLEPVEIPVAKQVEVPKPNVPIWDLSRAEEGEAFANTPAIDNRPIRNMPPAEVTVTPVMDQTVSNAVITEPPKANVVTLPTEVPMLTPAVSAQPTLFAPESTASAPTVNTTVSAPAVTEVPPVVKTDPYAGLEPTRRVDYVTPESASKKVRSVSDIVAELVGDTNKPEKSIQDSLVNLFTANGFKEELGLNNQDIIRMAISTVVGAKRYGVQRALAYAGRQAFEESSKRNTQKQADMRAIRSAAVQIRGQEVRDARAEENAEAAETRAINRENARREHDRFIAAQQEKMAAIKDRYNRDHDAARFEQQMRVLAAQQAQQDKRMQAMFGNQWAMMFAREDLKENSPRAKLERMEKHTDKAASAVSEIFKRDLGADDIKDQPNPARSGLPTPKQTTQQALSYLKRSGFDVTEPDAAQEATAIMNQATEQMIADKKSGRVKEVKDVTPYLARNVITNRLGLEPNLFNVGKDNKPMPAEKMTEIFGMVRGLSLDENGKADQATQAKLANRIATEWNGPNGKQYRKEFLGTDTESAYAQFMKSKLKELSK